MDIQADAILPFPRDLVFATYRDRLTELTEHLPNIRRIEETSRQVRDGDIHLVNEWVGGGEIPAMATAFLHESMLKWTDYATWKAESFSVDWRTEVHAFPGAIKSSGRNRFVEVPEGTRFELRGTFVVDASKVRGVPRFLESRVNGVVEKLFVGQIAANSLELAKAVGKLLASKPG